MSIFDFLEDAQDAVTVAWDELPDRPRDFSESVAKRLWKIGKNIPEIGMLGVDLIIDTMDTDDQGYVASAFDAFQDNVMGKAVGKWDASTNSITETAPENSMIDSLFGPTGIIGSMVEAIPEGFGVRETGRLVWSPVLEHLNWVQKNMVDRPIGTVVTGLSTAEAMAFDSGNREAYREASGMKDFGFFDYKLYQQIWDLTETRSAGQSIALYTKNINIWDADELAAAKNTNYYKVFSGINDFAINIYLDAPYLLAKSGAAAVKLKRIQRDFATDGDFGRASARVDDVDLGVFNKDQRNSARNKRRRAKGKEETIIDSELYEKFGYVPPWLKDGKGFPPPTSVDVLTMPKYMGFKEEIKNIVFKNISEMELPTPLSDQVDIDFAKGKVDLSKSIEKELNTLEEFDVQINKKTDKIDELLENRKNGLEVTDLELQTVTEERTLLEFNKKTFEETTTLSPDKNFDTKFKDELLTVRERLAPEKSSRQTFMDDATSKIVDAMRDGQLGRVWKNMPSQQQITYAQIYAGLVSAKKVDDVAWLPFDNFHKLILGNTEIVKVFESQAKEMANYLFNVSDEGIEALDQLADLNVKIHTLEDTIAAGLETSYSRTRLENLQIQREGLYEYLKTQFAQGDLGSKFSDDMNVVAEYNRMPWNAILASQDLLYKTIQKRVPRLIDETTPQVFDNLVSNADNNVTNIVDLAAKEIARTSHIPTTPLAAIPYLGPENRLGFSARTFFERTPINGIMDSRVYRMIVQKVTQNIVDVNDTDKVYVQTERLFRDMDQVEFDGTTLAQVLDTKEFGFITREKVLQQLQNIKTKKETTEILANLVAKSLEGLVELMLPGKEYAEIFNKQTVVKILQGQINDAQDLVRSQAEDVIAKGKFANADTTDIKWVAGSDETFNMSIPLSPSQAVQSVVLPRLDLYKRLLKFSPEDTLKLTNVAGVEVATLPLGSAMAKARNARRLGSTVWKRGVLLTPHWQMVVNIDSLARVVATVGAEATFAQIAGRWDTLQVRWLTNSGVDVTELIRLEIIEELRLLDIETNKGFRPVKKSEAIEAESSILDPDLRQTVFDEPVNRNNLDRRSTEIETPDPNSFVELVNKFIELNGNNGMEVFNDLVKNVIDNTYAKSRRNLRLSLATGLGQYFAGPAGAAASGAMYGKYARNSLAKTQEVQILKTYTQVIELEAHFLVDAINKLEAQAVAMGSDELSHVMKQILEKANSSDIPFEIDDLTDFINRNVEVIDEVTGERIVFTKQQVLDRTDVLRWDDIDFVKFFQEQKKMRQDAVKLINNHVAELTDAQRRTVEHFRKTNPVASSKFDQAAKQSAEAGLYQSDWGSVNQVNVMKPWGDTQQLEEVMSRVVSSNASKRVAWDNEVASQRSFERSQKTIQYNILEDPVSFPSAWDDYMRRHGSPQGKAGVQAVRDFWRQFYYPGILAKTDEEILQWLRTEGREILSELPDEYTTPEGLVALIRKTRYETQSLVPDLPEFVSVRRKLSEGNIVRWDSDINPVLVRMADEAKPMIDQLINTNVDPRLDPTGFVVSKADEMTFQLLDVVINKSIKDGQELTVTQAAQRIEEYSVVKRIREVNLNTAEDGNFGARDFGKTVTDSSFNDALQTGVSIGKVNGWITKVFENLSLTEDTLSRGVLYEGLYKKEIALNIQRFKIPGVSVTDEFAFRMDSVDIANVQKNAQTKALTETRAVLYDLAERSKFEDVMTEMAPFVGAFQEVISRWAGLAFDNPVFVARVLRPFMNATAKDENGQTLLGFTFPKIGGMTVTESNNYWINLVDRTELWTGVLGKLAESNMRFDLNASTLSMFGMGIGGPLPTWVAGETVLQVPELNEMLSILAPFGFPGGANALERFLDSHSPGYLRSIENAIGLRDNVGRAKTLRNVTQSYITQLHIAGIMPTSPQEVADFKQEIERRTKAIYGFRALKSIALPFSIQTNFPFHNVIQEFYRIEELDGPEKAELWLLDAERGHDFSAYLGRTTQLTEHGANSVMGTKAYRDSKDLVDEFPSILNYVTGEFGAKDIGIIYNKIVREGISEILDPESILTETQEAEGWREYRVFINKQHDLLLQGGNLDIRADQNIKEWGERQQFIRELKRKNPRWAEDFGDTEDPEYQKSILEAFRQITIYEIGSDTDNVGKFSSTFAYRPTIGLISLFLAMHDKMATFLDQQVTFTGKQSAGQLSNYPKLKQEWENGLSSFTEDPGFLGVYNRFFSGIKVPMPQNLSERSPKGEYSKSLGDN